MSRCILELKLNTQKWQTDVLDHTFRIAERMYNTLIRYAKKRLSALEANDDYQTYLSAYIKLLKKDELTNEDKQYKKELSKHLKELQQQYGLSEYQFHAYVVKMKNDSYQDTLDINTTQKLASRAWKSVSDYLYGDGNTIRFKKRGSFESIEGKTNKSGIRFNDKTNRLKFKKMEMPVVVRKNDTYAQTMLTYPICYCRIVRKPFKSGYKYFVQLVLKGVPPKKPELGVGAVGLDMGTSSTAAVGDNDAELIAHGITDTKTFKYYNKQIVKYSEQLERSRRINNPDNYNEDGTIKDGAKHWIRTKGYNRTLFLLKDAYRRKSAFVKQLHNRNANKILAMGDKFITEPMNWKALQKRSGKTERSDKETVITNKNGESKTIRKYKKKKRFGKSLNNHSPGLFESILRQKLSYYDKDLIYVDIRTYRASQYNPETDDYKKSELNERVKTICGQYIQRDLLSAFELQNPNADNTEIDKEKVKQKLSNFIAMHNECIARIVDKPSIPACMGLKHFK